MVTAVVLLILSLGIAGGYYWGQRKFPQLNGMKNRQTVSLQSLMNQPLTLFAEATDSDPDTSSPDPESATAPASSPARPDPQQTMLRSCRQSWRAIAETPGDQFQIDVAEGAFAIEGLCLQTMKKTIKDQGIREFLNTCLPTQRPAAQTGAPPPPSSPLCRERAPDFRNFIVQNLYARPSSIDYQEAPLPVLANLLNSQISALGSPGRARGRKAEDLDQTILLADEIMNRDPHVYEAYKAKLFALLMKESHDEGDVNENAYQDLIEEMASFENPDPLRLPSSALLLSQTNVELQSLSEQQQEVDDQRLQLQEEMGMLEEEMRTAQDPVRKQELRQQMTGLLAEQALLQQRENSLDEQAQNLERVLQEGVLTGQDPLYPDEVQVGFLRPLIKGNYEELVDEAENYLEDNPEDLIGYYYLAQGLWRQGEREEALQVIQSAPDQPQKQHLLKLFQETASTEPGKFLRQIFYP